MNIRCPWDVQMSNERKDLISHHYTSCYFLTGMGTFIFTISVLRHARNQGSISISLLGPISLFWNQINKRFCSIWVLDTRIKIPVLVVVRMTSVARSASEKRISKTSLNRNTGLPFFKFWSLMGARGFGMNIGDRNSIGYLWRRALKI